jgi:hypothetical protein
MALRNLGMASELWLDILSGRLLSDNYQVKHWCSSVINIGLALTFTDQDDAFDVNVLTGAREENQLDYFQTKIKTGWIQKAKMF